jgi:hypothetical protein
LRSISSAHDGKGTSMNGPDHGDIEERDPRQPARPEDELVMYLERDQLVFETSRRVPPAPLSGRAVAALWALRVFVVVVSAMVIYTFIDQLH